MEIPHIETRCDFLTKRDDYSINLYPSLKQISKVMEITHKETKWDFLTKRNDYSINLYPSPKQISKGNGDSSHRDKMGLSHQEG